MKTLTQNEQILFAKELGRLYIPKTWVESRFVDQHIGGWVRTGDIIKIYTHYYQHYVQNIDPTQPAELELWAGGENSIHLVCWYYKSLPHRIGGPARICMNGSTSYFIHGKRYEEEDYWNHPLIIQHKLDQLLLEE